MQEGNAKSSWTALIGAIVGAVMSGASLAFFFGGQLHQIDMNRQSIIDLRNARQAESGATTDAVTITKMEAMQKRMDEMGNQLVNGRNALIAENARLGVIESRIDDLRKEVTGLRQR